MPSFNILRTISSLAVLALLLSVTFFTPVTSALPIPYRGRGRRTVPSYLNTTSSAVNSTTSATANLTNLPVNLTSDGTVETEQNSNDVTTVYVGLGPVYVTPAHESWMDSTDHLVENQPWNSQPAPDSETEPPTLNPRFAGTDKTIITLADDMVGLPMGKKSPILAPHQYSVKQINAALSSGHQAEREPTREEQEKNKLSGKKSDAKEQKAPASGPLHH